MPIERHTKPERNLIILVHTGSISDDEFLSFYKDFFESNTFDPLMDLLVDLRETDSRPRSPDVLRQLVYIVKARLEGLTTSPKVAVVAPKNLSFGLARMYEALADLVDWDFMVFRATDAALAWLGLPEDLMNRHDHDA